MSEESEHRQVLRQVATAICTVSLVFASLSLALEPLYDGFRSPVGLACDAQGTMYITNWGGNTVERITRDGRRSVFIDDIASPAGIAIDRDGSIYVSSYAGNYIMRYSPDGTSRRMADGLATPAGISLAEDGRLLVANRAANEILAMDVKTGTCTVLADGFATPVGVVEMADGSIVVSQYGGRVTRVTSTGKRQELGQDFVRPGVGIVADGNDAIVVVDYGGGVVRRVFFDGQTSVVVRGVSGSPVALARDHLGALLVGTWEAGHVYRVPGQ